MQPLSLALEDLHWVDSETQGLLDSLVESMPTASMLLMVNYRPEYQHGWGGKSYYTQLRIDPLPASSCEDLLEGLLGADEHLRPLKQALIKQTQGNPFFLEESIRTLAETRVLVGERGSYRLVKPLAAIQIPATVQAILSARIDRLSPLEKHLLQAAAVIGVDVPFTLLQAIAEEPEDKLQQGLAHLQSAEFLYETGLFPEVEYTFRHGLTYEVAYGSVLHERRRALARADRRNHRSALLGPVDGAGRAPGLPLRLAARSGKRPCITSLWPASVHSTGRPTAKPSRTLRRRCRRWRTCRKRARRASVRSTFASGCAAR